MIIRRRPDVTRPKLRWITILQLLFLTMFIGVSYANDLRAQELLDQRISIQVSDAEIEKVLELIESQTKVRFIYSHEIIGAGRRVSFNNKNERLESVLQNLLNPLDISYEVSKKRTILLKKTSRKSVSQQNADVRNVVSSEKASLSVPDKTVKGKVIDEKGEPLPGVSVVVKGTTQGATTNTEGIYQLIVSENAPVLIFSFVGYISQEVAVGNMSTIDLTLKVDEKALEEVVVVGFGEQKKVSVTGAVSSINTEALQQNSSASLANALSGRLPGLTSIQSGGGQPGRDDAVMYLRGEIGRAHV